MYRPKLGLVLADSRNARIVLRNRDGGMEAIQALSCEAEPGFTHDNRGRVFESATHARHALAPRTGREGARRRAFARAIAVAVDAAVAEGTVKFLVLAAPSRLLKDVRDQLGHPARSVVVGEIHKDLMKAPEADLENRLDEMIV
ncbi:MAG TPA: host attachment protein [Caulobacteraceae bacterium]|jgi:protein required for attachment to host cells